ncbi:hypothetical protein JCM17380_16470 [Desulfosporosinus burensis]
MTSNAHLKDTYQRCNSIYARLDGNHIQTMDFVKFTVSIVPAQTKNNGNLRK